MNQRLLVVALVCLAVSVAVATAATTSDDRLAPDEEIFLHPHDGPNGAYAEVNGDGELEITADRLNPRAHTLTEDVFDVENRGNRVAWVWLTDGSDAVTFRHDGASIEGVENRERLRSDETAVVGFFVDAPTGTGSLLKDITVHVHTNAGLQLNGAVRDGQTRPGQPAEVDVTIQNAEDETAEAFLALRAEHDGADTVVREDIVTVEGGATQDPSYGLVLPEAGEWTVSLNDEQIGTVSVAEPQQSGDGDSSRTGDRGQVKVSDLSVTPTEVAIDETVIVSVRVRNTHYGARTRSVEITGDDETVAERTARLPGGSQLRVRYEHRFEEPGTYEVGVRSLESVTVTVTEAPEASEPEPTESEPPPVETPTETSTETPTPTTAIEESTRGLGILAVLVAILVAVAVHRQFRHHHGS